MVQKNLKSSSNAVLATLNRCVADPSQILEQLAKDFFNNSKTAKLLAKHPQQNYLAANLLLAQNQQTANQIDPQLVATLQKIYAADPTNLSAARSLCLFNANAEQSQSHFIQYVAATQDYLDGFKLLTALVESSHDHEWAKTLHDECVQSIAKSGLTITDLKGLDKAQQQKLSNALAAVFNTYLNLNSNSSPRASL